ncbi:VOC family protein [Eubacteriales bacterium OttesenSCG-928-A19]|nr:VOC family protein [Eubacteriales bacterium OttesenSCG-928-A19]
MENNTPTIDLKGLIQIAFVVKDIESVARNWSEVFGIPMPEIHEITPPEECQIYYRGEKSFSRAKIACIELGPIAIELTEPDAHDSSWKEFLERHGGNGIHHLGFSVGSDDRRDAVIRMLGDRGIGVRHYGYYPGGSYTFVDSEEQLGVILNIKPHA